MDCIFCKIANGQMNADIIYQDDYIVAFNDINPQAPTHILVIPKEHSDNLLNTDPGDLGHIFKGIKHIVKKLQLDNEGFRVVNNCGENGGQTVEHTHFHILGGRKMLWPPG